MQRPLLRYLLGWLLWPSLSEEKTMNMFPAAESNIALLLYR